MPLIRKPSPAPQASAAVSAPLNAAGLAKAISQQNDIRSRASLFTELACLRSPEAAQAAVAFLFSDDAGLRAGAMDALRAMPEVARQELAGLLRNPDVDVRQLACELARTCGGPETPALLSRVLIQDQDANVCAAAVDVLAEIGDGESLRALQACASRFPGQSFLTFAVRVAVDRISKTSTDRA